eukprot:20427-Pelagococcus_subviridis.AAC.3
MMMSTALPSSDVGDSSVRPFALELGEEEAEGESERDDDDRRDDEDDFREDRQVVQQRRGGLPLLHLFVDAAGHAHGRYRGVRGGEVGPIAVRARLGVRFRHLRRRARARARPRGVSRSARLTTTRAASRIWNRVVERESLNRARSTGPVRPASWQETLKLGVRALRPRRKFRERSLGGRDALGHCTTRATRIARDRGTLAHQRHSRAGVVGGGGGASAASLLRPRVDRARER